MAKKFERTHIDKLKGVKIFYENDFYEYAKVTIQIRDAYETFQKLQGKSPGIRRPTIHGLAKKFATTVDDYFSAKYVHDILEGYGFTGREMLDIKGEGKPE